MISRNEQIKQLRGNEDDVRLYCAYKYIFIINDVAADKRCIKMNVLASM